MKRRDKIGRAYLPKINPLVRFALDERGALTFQNAAVAASVAPAPAGGYHASWHRFDNAMGETQAIGLPTASTSELIAAPAGLPGTEGAFIRVGVSAADPTHVSWSKPVTVYFQRVGGAWKLVGLERLP